MNVKSKFEYHSGPVAIHPYLVATAVGPPSSSNSGSNSATHNAICVQSHSAVNEDEQSILRGTNITDISALAFFTVSSDALASDPDACNFVASAARDSIDVWQVEKSLSVSASEANDGRQFYSRKLPIIDSRSGVNFGPVSPQFVMFSPDASVLAVGRGCELILYEFDRDLGNDNDNDSEPVVLDGHSAIINDAAFAGLECNGNDCIVTVSSDRTFRIMKYIEVENENDWKWAWVCVYKSAVLSPFSLLCVSIESIQGPSVAVNEDSEWLAIGCSDGTVLLYRLPYDVGAQVEQSPQPNSSAMSVPRLVHSFNPTKSLENEDTLVLNVTVSANNTIVAIYPTFIMVWDCLTLECISKTEFCDCVPPIPLVSSALVIASANLEDDSPFTRTACLTCAFSSVMYCVELSDTYRADPIQIEVGAAGSALSIDSDSSPSPLVQGSVLRTGIVLSSSSGSSSTVGGSGKGKGKGKGKKQGDQPVTFHRAIKSSGYSKPPAVRSMFTGTRGHSRGRRRGRGRGRGRGGGRKHVGNVVTKLAGGGAPDLCLNSSNCTHTKVPIFDSDTPVLCMEQSPSGKSMVCGSSDGSLQLLRLGLDIDIGIGIGSSRSISGHSGLVSSVGWSSTASYIVSSSADGSVRVWSTGGASHSGELLDLSTYEGNVNSSSSSSGKLRGSLPSVRSASFFYKDRFLFVAAGSSILLYRLALEDKRAKNELLRTPDRSKCVLAWSDSSIGGAQRVMSLAVQNIPLSRLAISSWSNRAIAISDVNHGVVVHQISNAHGRVVEHIALESKANNLVHDVFMSIAADSVKLWDLRSCTALQAFSQSQYSNSSSKSAKSKTAQSVSVRGSIHWPYIAFGSEDGTASIVDMRSVRIPVYSLNHTPTCPIFDVDLLTSASASTSTSAIYTAGGDGCIGVWR